MSPVQIEIIRDVSGRHSQRTEGSTNTTSLASGCACPAPRPHKQYLLSVACVYPLSLAIPWLLELLWQSLAYTPPELVAKLLSASLLVALLVWCVYPLLTPRLMSWLTR